VSTEPKESLQDRLARARQAIARRSEGAVTPSLSRNVVQPPLRPRRGLEDLPAIHAFEAQKDGVAAMGLASPYFRAHHSLNGASIRIEDRELLNFSGYNYLGLSGHPEVTDAAKRAIDLYGTSASASRLASGEMQLHGELEQALASALQVEDALVFVSGYGTNVSIIGHLFGPNDLVIHDSLAHSSVVAGCLLSGARRLAFPHNDVAALNALLTEHRQHFERAVILVEGVYSMDGDIAPLDRLIEIKQRHDAALMVDEAHSIGVLGEHGYGIGEYFKVNRTDVDIWMGTLSKTLASCGGYIAGSRRLIEYLRYTTPGFVYSVGLSPPDSAAALAALRIMQREPERVDKLRRLAAFFVEKAREHGLDTGSSLCSAIVPVILGASILTLRIAQRLFDSGINVHPIIYPATEEGKARLRFFVSAMHSEDDLRRAADAVANALTTIKALDAAPARA
jgi:8-amino-7-oxononanoate synthase